MIKGSGATFVGVALLASATAFAQTTAPKTTTTSPSTTTAHDRESPAQPVTLIGCVQKESDYRKAHNIKKGGGLNMGIGDGDEYMLINATRVSGGVPSVTTVGDCTAGSGEAFELTGPKEEQFKNFVGKRVEVSGTQKRAKLAANGQPTGGSAPGGGELKLFEVEVASVKEAAVATAQVQRSETTVQTPAPATTAPAPAATTAPAPAPAREPAPTATAGQQQQPAPTQTSALPRTASPLPLYELASLLCFGGAYGVRRLRRK